jgi:hypothetical protein
VPRTGTRRASGTPDSVSACSMVRILCRTHGRSSRSYLYHIELKFDMNLFPAEYS